MSATTRLLLIILAGTFGFSSSGNVTREVPNVGASAPTDNNQHDIFLTEDVPAYNLFSPGFPDSFYPPNTQVYYDVKVDLAGAVTEQAARILLTFDMFALEVSDFCAKDGLEIFEKSYQTRVYCAGQSGRVLLSEGSSLRMRFFSDDNQQARGFSIRAEIYYSPCAQDFVNLLSGSFSTPKFPRDYANNELCVWRIQAPSGKRVRVGFNEVFDIQGKKLFCINDYLAVSKEGDLMQDSDRLCGNQAPTEIISVGEVLLLKFVSDCCYQGRGFSASFTIIDGAPPPTPEPEIPTNCACGKENLVEERIIGGEDVTPPHRFPWMLGIVDVKEKVQCGATLISKLYALTAAHCAVASILAPDKAKVLLGAFDLDNPSREYVGIDRYIIHPKFDRRTYANDIALIKFIELVDFSHDVRPICLPSGEFDTKDRDALVCGWGALDEVGTEYSKTLKFVELPTLPLPQCMEKYGTMVTEQHLCAGGEKKDACQGDSGGPLFTQVDGRWIIIGVVSAGIGCGREGYPGIFMNVPSYADWITESTQDSPACDAFQPIGPLQPNIEDCGLASRHIESRVAGGSPSENDYPWMTFITFSYRSNNQDFKFNGVGAMISPKFVLTAVNWMQTWYQQYPNLFTVSLGRYDLSKNEMDTQRDYSVKTVNINPKYQDTAPFDNDMAILELTTEVNTVFRPVCLPATLQFSDDSDATAIGWGRTNTGAYNYILQQIEVQIINQKKCSQAYTQQSKVTSNMLCAAGDGQGMCKGDAGSPLMIFSSDRYYLIGLASFGSSKGCAVKGYPDVYSAVNSQLQWIADVTNLQVK